jgi:HAD superfamily hydrolase (TIGR01509 family)
MKDYDAYLFDWDGTLATTLDIWLSIFISHLGKYGIQAADKDIVFKMFGRVEKGALELGLPKEKLDEFISEVKASAPGKLAAVTLYPDVRELLTLLKAQNKKLGLITASYRHVVDAVVRERDAIELFDVVVTGDDIKAHKPDPEGIELALKQLDIEPSRALMLGDSDKDLQAAQNAKTDSLLFFPKEHHLFHDRGQLEGLQPTHVVTSWRELIDQLQ